MNIEDLFSGAYQAGREDADAVRMRGIFERRRCEADGHQYQVVGAKSPARLACRRCRCTWAIGAKTEPTS